MVEEEGEGEREAATAAAVEVAVAAAVVEDEDEDEDEEDELALTEFRSNLCVLTIRTGAYVHYHICVVVCTAWWHWSS